MRILCHTATLLAAFVCHLPSQDAVLRNLANVPRKQWVDVAVPLSDASTLTKLCRFDPQGWIAFKGRTIGQHSVLFHVLATLGANQSVSGRFTPVTNDPTAFSPWVMSDWVGDNFDAVRPRPVVLDMQGVEHRLVNPVLETVENVSPARRVLKYWGRLGTTPLVFESYIYVYARQDAVNVETTITCASPTLVGMTYDFQLLWLESGEYLALDYRTRLGLPTPFKQTSMPTHPSFGHWVQVVSGPRTLGRGEGMGLSGATLCLVEGSRPVLGHTYATNGLATSWSVGERVDQLIAEYRQPCVGLWQHWEGKWLAFGVVPELPIPFRADNGAANADASWNAFQGLMQTPGDLYDQRPRGLFRHAPTTGAQEDFGASKGSLAVTVGDPRWIHDAGYSVTEVMMRGFHHREVDGRPMRRANHPALQCFNQLPNCRTTGDTLGYPCPLPYTWPTAGYSVFDDQHRSQNNFNALLALTGSWALKDQLRDLAEVDHSLVPNWMDTPRAEGRLQMAWSNMLLLLEDPADRAAMQATMSARLQYTLNNWPGRHFVGNPAKPVRALQVGSDPTFLETNGTRVTAIVTWEHSIATMGFFAAWRVTGDNRFRDLAAEVSRLIVERCCFLHSGSWIAATAIRYLQGAQEGDALPASTYYPGSPDVHVSLNFWQWVLPSVLICRELHRTSAPGLAARCDAILQNVAPNGPADWLTSEWWAVLPR